MAVTVDMGIGTVAVSKLTLAGTMMAAVSKLRPMAQTNVTLTKVIQMWYHNTYSVFVALIEFTKRTFCLADTNSCSKPDGLIK